MDLVAVINPGHNLLILQISVEIAGAGDPLVLEEETPMRDRVLDAGRQIDGLWEQLRGTASSDAG